MQKKIDTQDLNGNVYERRFATDSAQYLFSFSSIFRKSSKMIQ